MAGGYAPIIQGIEENSRPNIRLLAQGNLPQPIRISSDFSLMGSVENSWVEASGVVREIARL